MALGTWAGAFVRLVPAKHDRPLWECGTDTKGESRDEGRTDVVR